ncbi:hypothetical protein PtB15_1B102 [Puccinia triticina]|nr:hypothetical protein PtB15_1B102 [Puccinia triticina]
MYADFPVLDSRFSISLFILKSSSMPRSFSFVSVAGLIPYSFSHVSRAISLENPSIVPQDLPSFDSPSLRILRHEIGSQRDLFKAGMTWARVD